MLLRLLVLVGIVWFVWRWLQKVTSPAETPRRRVPCREGEPDPHAVLGVDQGASREEIRKAYQHKIREYHPDRIAEMGIELRELAEKRTKEINAAYAQLKGR